MKTIELVIQDWTNLTQQERETVIEDIRSLAKTFPEASPIGEGRRGRGLNIAASFLHFFTNEVLFDAGKI